MIAAILSVGPLMPSERDWVQSRSALGQPITYGFMTSCREHFTTQVKVILRVCLLKLETVKQRKDLGVEATRESLGSSLLCLPRNILGKE